LRQPILYAEATWRRQRLWALVLAVAAVVVNVTMLIGNHWTLNLNNRDTLISLGYLPLTGLFFAFLLVYRWRNYAQVTDAGLRVSNLLSSMVIGYEQIRSARVQPLERHFQDGRGRHLRPEVREMVRNSQPALFVKLERDDAALARVQRKLGRQLVFDDTVAFPVADPDALAWEVTSRLPERGGANLGGQRRRKRRR
jgi:hypothetical protein